MIVHCIYVLHLLYPSLCRWTFRLLPCLGYCKQCCKEHWDACTLLIMFFSGYMPRGGTALFLVFLRNLHTILHSGYTSWWVFLKDLQIFCREFFPQLLRWFQCPCFQDHTLRTTDLLLSTGTVLSLLKSSRKLIWFLSFFFTFFSSFFPSSFSSTLKPN